MPRPLYFFYIELITFIKKLNKKINLNLALTIVGTLIGICSLLFAIFVYFVGKENTEIQIAAAQVSNDRNVPVATLVKVAKLRGYKNVPEDHAGMVIFFDEIASQYINIRDSILAIKSSDEKISTYRQNALKHVNDGEFEKAQGVLMEIEKYLEIRSKISRIETKVIDLERIMNLTTSCSIDIMIGTTDSIKNSISTYNKAISIAETFDKDFSLLLKAGLAQAKTNLGEHTGDRELIFESIDILNSILDDMNKQDNIMMNIVINYLTTSYHIIGKWDNDTNIFESSLTKLGKLIEKIDKETQPIFWVIARNNYSIFLVDIGERKKNLHIIDDAIHILNETLNFCNDKKIILESASIYNTLGNAYFLKGRIDNHKQIIEESISCYKLAHCCPVERQ